MTATIITIASMLILLILGVSVLMIGLCVGADKSKTDYEKELDDKEQIEWLEKNFHK
jgi:hypothetical protein